MNNHCETFEKEIGKIFDVFTLGILPALQDEAKGKRKEMNEVEAEDEEQAKIIVENLEKEFKKEYGDAGYDIILDETDEPLKEAVSSLVEQINNAI